MTPSQLSFLRQFEGSPVAISIGPSVPKSFADQFLAQSNFKLPLREEEKARVRELLEILEKAGYSISQTQICHGNYGDHWPVLISPRGMAAIFGIATGVVGSRGMGTGSIIDYLENQRSFLETTDRTTAAYSSAMSSRSSSSASSSSSDHAKRKSRKSHSKKSSKASCSMKSPETSSASDLERQERLLKKFGAMGANVSIVGGRQGLSLWRARGLLNEPAGESKNQLTAENFLGSELFCFRGKLLVSRGGRVLAKDKDLVILPKEKVYGSVELYNQGNSSYSDVPCGGHMDFRVKLEDMSQVVEILPYLNALDQL